MDFINKIQLVGKVDNIHFSRTNNGFSYQNCFISFPEINRKRQNGERAYSHGTVLNWNPLAVKIEEQKTYIFHGKVISKVSYRYYSLTDDKANALCNVLKEESRFSNKIRSIVSILNLGGTYIPRYRFAIEPNFVKETMEQKDSSINEVQLCGKISGRPNYRITKQEMPRLYFPIQVPFRNRMGNMETNQFDIVLYGDMAEKFRFNLGIDKDIFIKGSLSARVYKADSLIKPSQIESLCNLLNIKEDNPLLEQVVNACGFKTSPDSWFVYDIIGTDLFIMHP